MFCWHCGARLPDDGARCPVCGKASVITLDDAAREGSAEEQKHRLLTQANLLRMRKDWQTATLRCTEALRVAPKSASAHSLLGDICRDQGRLNDAMDWYKLALSLDPTRRADREKLDEIIDEMYGATGGYLPVKEAPEAETESPSNDGQTGFPLGRYAAFFMVALVAITLSALLLNYHDFKSALTTDISIVKPRKRPQAGIVTTGPLDIGAQSQAAGRRTESPAAQPPQGPAPAAPATTAPAAPNASRPAITMSDAALEAAMSRAIIDYDPQAAILWASVDPRARSAAVAFAAPEGYTLEQTRRQLLLLGLFLGKEAALQEPGLDAVTIRASILYQTPEGGFYHEVAFIGESRAQALRTTVLSEIPQPELEAFFSDVWWQPLLGGSR